MSSKVHPRFDNEPTQEEVVPFLHVNTPGGKTERVAGTLIGVIEHVHRATGLLKFIHAEMREHTIARQAPPQELTAALEDLRDQVGLASEIVNQDTPGIAAPTSALVTAQLEAGVIDGRRNAEMVALRAGFMGGSGLVGIIGTIGIGVSVCPIIFGYSSYALKHGTTLEGSMAFLLGYIFNQPLAILAFARAVCLIRRQGREAHQCTILAFAWAGTIGLVYWTLTTEFYFLWGCSCLPAWKSQSDWAPKLGRQCGLVEGILSLMYIIMMSICSIIAVRLYELRREEANKWALRLIFVYCMYWFFFTCVAFYIEASPVYPVSMFIFVGIIWSTIEYKRYSAQKQAAKTLEDDLEQYNLLWAKISQEGQHPAIVRIQKTVATEQQHITDVKHGKLSRHGDDVLKRVVDRGSVQRIHSLALIFASAHTLNPHFQKKAIAWGAKHEIQVKQAARAVEKVLRSYANDARRLKDLVRNNVPCATLDEVTAVFERIAADDTVEIVHIKNGFCPGYDAKKSGGYRDIKLSLVVVDAFARASAVEEHICELQILLEEMKELKEERGGHDRYQEARDAMGA